MEAEKNLRRERGTQHFGMTEKRKKTVDDSLKTVFSKSAFSKFAKEKKRGGPDRSFPLSRRRN